VVTTHSTSDHKASANKEQQQACTQQLVSQLEPLLYLAYRLQLTPLQEVLHEFIRGCTYAPMKGILRGHMCSVLAPRVTQAAAEAGLIKEDSLLQQLVTQRCSLAGAEDGLFEPVDLTLAGSTVSFKARVKRPLPGFSQGQVVDVVLVPSTHTLKVANMSYECRLLIGPLVNTPGTKEAILGKVPAAAPTT
jgi:hypothetical protein